MVQLAARLGGLLRGVAGGPAGTLLAGAGDDGVVGPACKAGLKVGWPQTGWSEATHKQAGPKPAQTGWLKAGSKPANLLVVFATVGKHVIALAIRHQMSDNRHNGGPQICRAHTCHRRRERKSKGANSCLT